MKKILSVLICIIVMLTLASCSSTQEPTGTPGNPDNNESYDDAKDSIGNITDTSDKDEIEKNIKEVFGVDISLPEGSEYIAETVELDSVSSYVIMVKGATVSEEEYYNSIKSAFGAWTEIPGEHGFSYQTENVIYGVVVEGEDEYLGIAFSISDKEVTDQFVSGNDEFINEIKKYSSVTLVLPECVESVALASHSNDGAKASYGGMLVGENSSLNKEEFDEFVSSIDSQLTGYTKTVDGDATDMTVVWTDNSDPTRYFEASYYEFEGTPMCSFSYNYVDKSMLTPWPTDEINAFMGTDAGVPEYNGMYDKLTFDDYGEYGDYDSISIYLSGVTEDEFDAYLDVLVANGFTRMGGDSEYSDEYWSKSITETLFVEIRGFYSQSYWNDSGEATIYVYKTVLENVTWPESEISEQFGEKAAAKIPGVEGAPRRTFEVYDEDYSYIYIKDIVDEDLYADYCTQLEALGFTLEDEWEYSREYLYQWDDYDRLTLAVSYTGEDDAGEKYIRIHIISEPYEPFVDLPQNVKITSTASSYYLSEPTITTTIKMGEDWYISGTYGIAYYEYNSADNTWSVYNGYRLGNDGEITWMKDSKSYDRYEVDKKLKSAISDIYVSAVIEDNEEYTKGQSVTVSGQECVEYSLSYSYGSSYGSITKYYLQEDMKIVFKTEAIVISDGEERSSTTEITEFNTSISSFADAGITSDMLPSE